MSCCTSDVGNVLSQDWDLLSSSCVISFSSPTLWCFIMLFGLGSCCNLMDCEASLAFKGEDSEPCKLFKSDSDILGMAPIVGICCSALLFERFKVTLGLSCCCEGEAEVAVFLKGTPSFFLREKVFVSLVYLVAFELCICFK